MFEEHHQENLVGDCNHDQKSFNLKRKLFLDDPKELIEHLNKVPHLEILQEELNGCKPVEMDFYELAEALYIGENDVSNECNNFNKSKKECFQFDTSKTQIDFIDNLSKSDSKENSDDLKKYCEENRKYMDVVMQNNTENIPKKFIFYHDYKEIEPQIHKYISDGEILNKLHYFNRLEDINFLYDNFDRDVVKNEFSDTSSDFLGDIDDISNLNKIVLSFDENLMIFNQKNCENLLEEIYKKIFNKIKWVRGYERLEYYSVYQKKKYLFSQLIKFYKYINEIPELLTLSSIFLSRLGRKNIIITHQIIFLLENIDNLKKKRFFVLSMIYQSFKMFYGEKLVDSSFFFNYKLVCGTIRHDFYYFIWEIDHRKRCQLRRRKNYVCYPCSDLRSYFKTILLIHMLRFTVFIKYFNLSSESCRKFFSFFQEVIDSEKCIDLHFKKFLSLIQIICREVDKLQIKDSE
ncbi:hypothetical protein NBO_206g0003 [Nosema bombycis CQ1]|uniref:Uncharacterized protein n=1 Tax=Nosema bombycis (strain CQ1 / CVCC 102059) TaxID=578461 RepID=R0M500_NOSB1|nr:hypothetical protein NBO_206g0003 [Nosema bombycis CQ1]|eukprot:EOB13079.1 hypothetical protein NBO_206g0003 [Nosema bombycis CQ1]